MTNWTHLDRAQVPAQLRGAYTGTRFQVCVTDKVHIPIDAGLWDGGSRDTFNALRVADGAAIPFPGQDAAPWDNARKARDVALVPGMAVVEHSISRGKDMGLRFYLHPSDAAPLLPAPVEPLDHVSQLVLNYTMSRKASYMGRDRYQMALEDMRYAVAPEGGAKPVMPTREAWDAAKVALISRGFLNRAGAITTAGRNLAKYF